MNLILSIEESNILKKEFDGQELFSDLNNHLETFMFLVPKILTNEFGELTPELRQEKQTEIENFIKSDRFKVLMDAEQVIILSNMVYNIISSLNSKLGSSSKTEDIFNLLIASKEIEDKEIQDKIFSYLNKNK